MLDIGTGSGILCFVVMLLGAQFCFGLEIDPDCRENIAENREMNATGGAVTFVIGSTDALKSTTQFDFIMMNMIYTESAPLLPLCQLLVERNSPLIWSGILNYEKDEAVTSATNAGFILIDELVENEWWCGIFNSAS